jgi:hypothetical protein
MKYPLPPIDARGRRISIGSRVRIVGVPDLTGMKHPYRRRSEAVFRHLVGACKRVGGFDQYGCAELTFSIQRGPNRGMHWVAIEPFLLLVQRQ